MVAGTSVVIAEVIEVVRFWVYVCDYVTYKINIYKYTLYITYCYLLGWPKGPFIFFHEIKGTFSIFTNNFIDLDILSTLAISPYWLLGARGQGCC